MGFLNKPFIILAAVWFVLLFFSGLSIAGLKAKNELLSQQNEELTSYLNDALNDKATIKANLAHCDATISSQNQAIKANAVQVKGLPNKESERIKKIYVKDKGCEAELRAYKELFK